MDAVERRELTTSPVRIYLARHLFRAVWYMAKWTLNSSPSFRALRNSSSARARMAEAPSACRRPNA
eukprot:9798588-Lingulodinium_polyedra.AAC.1